VRDLRAATDEELLALTARQPRAFDEFYVRHESLVLGYFRRRTDSPDVALDLTAETFVQALASVPRFRTGPEPAVA
jgi:RNA polymerase sigma-70 factor (ECF subfamily)